VLLGGAGDDKLVGGVGTDTAVFSGDRSAYTISTVDGVTTVTGLDGTDRLTEIERLQFADGLYDLAGDPLAAPQTLPAAQEHKTGALMDDPFVLPAAADEDMPPVLPPADDALTFKPGFLADQPEVLPPAEVEPWALLLSSDGQPFPSRESSGLYGHDGFNYVWNRDDFLT